MDLNNDQFKDWLGPYHHGTQDLDDVIDIFNEGFHVGAERNGRSAGNGVYLARSHKRAQEFGDYVIKAYVHPNTNIAPKNLYESYVNDIIGGDWKPEKHADDFGDYARHHGYSGHTDPDTGDIVIHSGSNVSPADFKERSK